MKTNEGFYVTCIDGDILDVVAVFKVVFATET